MLKASVHGIVVTGSKQDGNLRIQWHGPRWAKLSWIAWPLTIVGVTINIAAFAFLRDTTLLNLFQHLFELCITTLFGGAVTLTGIVTIKMARDIPKALPASNLAMQLGVTEARLQEAAKERGVVAPYSVNGVDYFRPEDFEEASLLRGASRSVPEGQLLRAAEERAETSTTELLRAAGIRQKSTEEISTQEPAAIYPITKDKAIAVVETCLG